MSEPTDEIFLKVFGRVPGCPARVGQVVLIQDDGPGRRLTLRVGTDKASARTAKPSTFSIALLRWMIACDMKDEEHFDFYHGDVISLEQVRKRWAGINGKPEPRTPMPA